jgi:hypothetical protein
MSIHQRAGGRSSFGLSRLGIVLDANIEQLIEESAAAKIRRHLFLDLRLLYA